jgi:TetR/AcrR family transcriptional regulator, repressor for uid operon
MTRSNHPAHLAALTPEAHVRRGQILAAATRLFASQGFHGTGMRDICKEAEISIGALYRYFPAKEDIINALILRDREQTRAQFADVPAGIGFMEALTLMLRASIQRMENQEYLSLWTEIEAEAVRNPKVQAWIMAHCDEAEEQLARLITLAQEKRSVAKDVEPREAARWILFTFDGLMIRRGRDPEFDFARAGRSCLQFIAHALGAVQPRGPLR